LPTGRAQDLYVTNLNQFVAEAYSIDHCIYFPQPLPPFWACSSDGGQPWWADCSQVDCTNLLTSPTNLVSGVTAYPVVLTKNLLTGETTMHSPGTTNVVATVPAPAGFEPGVLSEDASVWQWYQQFLQCVDCWGFDGDDVPPPTVLLVIYLADVNDYPTYAAYQDEQEAEAEAAQAAQPANSIRGFTPMDDDGGGDGDGDPPPPDGTGIEPVPSGHDPPFNLLQPFAVSFVQQTSKGIRITWQSAQWSRYLVWYTSDLTSNVWTPQAYVWGQTNSGLTSYIDTTSTNQPQRFYKVQRLLGSQITAGAENSVAISPDGRLWAWGRNDGNLGDGLDSQIQANGNYVEPYLPYPSDVAGVMTCGQQTITNAAAVAAGGDDFTLVVDNGGGCWSFGEDTEGQLGRGLGGYDSSGVFTDSTLYPVPVRIAGLSNVVSVAAGFGHALALRADGSVAAWGSDSDNSAPPFLTIYGQLGVGGLASGQTNAPVQSLVPTGTVIVAIAAGGYHSVALDANGRVWTFGYGYYGQLGNGATTNVYLPTMLTTISNVIAIAAGDEHTLALTADKFVYSFGYNYYGELGRSDPNGGYDPLPGQVPGLSNVVAIAAGWEFSLAVTSNGQIYAWGDNSQSELATNSTDVPHTNSPMLVAGISNAVLVAAPVKGDAANDFSDKGGRHVVAMTLDPVDGTGQTTNHYWGWGDSSDGEAGSGISGNTSTEVPTNQVTPAQLQFCTRCQREVQLGTGGVFTAQCSGTLYLYFNGEIGQFGNYSGSYTATVNGVQFAVPANDPTWAGTGVRVGPVTQGSNYTYTASGLCVYDSRGFQADPNGVNPATSNLVTCTSSTFNFNFNKTNSICPWLQCFSLVGKIQ
jgi:alpha-tubulin suppressor-like RCC1 family protein